MAQASLLAGGRRLEPSDSPEYVASVPMSFDEYLTWDYEGGLVEWIDGRAYVYVSATFEHQHVVGFLSRLLGLWAEETGEGTVVTAPYAMRSAEGQPGREPDIAYVSSTHRGLLQSRYLAGAPDLIIEVVSPDSVVRDRTVKRAEYAEAGVREYWIIDARPEAQTAEFLVLKDGRWIERQTEAEVYRSEAAEGFWFRLEWLWEFDRPVLLTLGTILRRPLFGEQR